MRDFHELKVWEKSHTLTLAVYEATRTFPKDEIYGVTAQIRRAAASIPANLAEGCGRDGEAELARFCQIAMGSASELEYHLILCRDLQYLEQTTFEQLSLQNIEVKRMLSSFIRAVKPKSRISTG